MEPLTQRGINYRDSRNLKGQTRIGTETMCAYIQGAKDEHTLMMEFMDWYAMHLKEYCAGNSKIEWGEDTGGMYDYDAAYDYWLLNVKGAPEFQATPQQQDMIIRRLRAHVDRTKERYNQAVVALSAIYLNNTHKSDLKSSVTCKLIEDLANAHKNYDLLERIKTYDFKGDTTELSAEERDITHKVVAFAKWLVFGHHAFSHDHFCLGENRHKFHDDNGTYLTTEQMYQLFLLWEKGDQMGIRKFFNDHENA